MLMADTLNIFLIVLGFLVALPGLWLLCRGLWPNVVQETTEDCQRGLLFPFLVGLPIAAVAVVTTIIVSKSLGGASGLGSLFVVCIFVFFASVGIAGLTTSIGMKLPSPADAERPWKATIRGSVVIELAFLLPILGWFIILPSALIIGSGSTLRSIIKMVRNRPRKDKAAPVAGNGDADRPGVFRPGADKSGSSAAPAADTPDLGLGGSFGAA
jgi:hypothetical protein